MYLSQSELRQLELLKKKTPAERFFLMAQLIQGQREAMKASIKYQNPKMEAGELKKCLRNKMMEIYFGKRWEEKFR